MAHPPRQESVLIASIGNRDPGTDKDPTCPLRAAREYSPSRAFLLATAGVLTNAEDTRKSIEAAVQGCAVTIVPLNAANPAVPEDVQVALETALRQVDGEMPAQARVIVGATSGTTAISVSLTLAALARWPDAVHVQALDPNKAPAPHLRQIDMDAFSHGPEVEQALRALEECRVAEAAALFGRRAAGSAAAARSRKHLLSLACRFASAVNLADSLNPSDGLKLLNSVKVKTIPDGIRQTYESLRNWYMAMSEGRDRQPSWPVELCARAMRLREAGRANDALVAFAIATEVAAGVRLKEKHHLDPERIDPALPDLEAARERNDLKESYPRRGAAPYQKVEGWKARWQLLADLEPALQKGGKGGLITAVSQPVPRFVAARNDLVHAAKQAQECQLEDACSFFATSATLFSWPDPAACPSSPHAIKAFARALRPAIGAG